MKKFVLGLVIVLIIVLLVPLTMMGLVPGLSKLVGTGVKDLGIKITKEDSVAAQTKMGIEIISLPKDTPLGDDFRLEGKKEAKITMDSKELTAHSNNRLWKNYPVKNVQIKIADDGTVEASGILIIAKAVPYAMGLGYSEADINAAMKKYKIPPFEVPVYLKGQGSVTNDISSIKAASVQIGAIPVPDNIVSAANVEAENVVNDLISKNSQSFHAESLKFKDGKMIFAGQLPEREYVITE